MRWYGVGVSGCGWTIRDCFGVGVSKKKKKDVVVTKVI